MFVASTNSTPGDASQSDTKQTAKPATGGMSPVPITLSEEQLASLKRQIREELEPTLAAHAKRQETFAGYLRAYKARPEHERKTFPWDGASNVVVPVVAIAVDSVSARLQKSIFAAKDIVEVKIGVEEAEKLEKTLRDHLTTYLREFAQQELRDMFFDEPLYGMAYVKVVWEKKTRVAHFYDSGFNVTSEEKTAWEGPRWYIVHPADIIRPEGFDKWEQLPWIAHRLRYTWREVAQKSDWTEVEKLKNTRKQRDDPHYKVVQESKDGKVVDSIPFCELFEIWGVWEVPSQTNAGQLEWAEVIVTYSLDADHIVSAIYNPFFGHTRHIVQVPFLVQSHELDGMGVAEMTLQFQHSASASHNQQIDAGTVANAGVIVTTTGANFGENERIYPGKKITTEDPSKDVRVIQLGQPSAALGAAEQKAWQYAEKRTGVGAYQLGQESPIVGSQATATGTTALIAEGNIRFWVSIDDMRKAIEELLNINLLLEQQMRPEGIDTPNGKLVLPQGDLRQLLGLRLAVSSETINRDLEIQNIQMLVAMLNEYYGRVMQAAAIIQNPQFPPAQKAIVLQIMNSAHDLMRRLVERFDFENIDTLVPSLLQALQQTMGVMGGMAGMGAPPAGAIPGAAGGGPPVAGPPAGPGGQPGGAPAQAGNGEVSVQ